MRKVQISTHSRDNFLTTPTAAVSAEFPNYIPFELIEYCSVTRHLSQCSEQVKGLGGETNFNCDKAKTLNHH